MFVSEQINKTNTFFNVLVVLDDHVNFAFSFWVTGSCCLSPAEVTGHNPRVFGEHM